MISEEELEKVWRALDSRIRVLEERTKIHTIQIRNLKQERKNEN